MNVRNFVKLVSLIGLTIASVISNTAVSAGNSGSEFTIEDFRLNSAQELVDVCLLEESSEHHEIAQAFCYGFFEGAVHYDEVISKLVWYQDLVCPTPGTTRQQGVAAFLDYMKENPEYGSEQPVDAIFRALGEKWPCPE